MPRDNAQPAPGSAFPEIAFEPKRVKVTIIAVFEVGNENDVACAKSAVQEALKSLDAYDVSPSVTAHYEKV